MASYRFIFRAFLLCFSAIFIIFVLTGLQLLYYESKEYGVEGSEHYYALENKKENEDVKVVDMEQKSLQELQEDIPYPIVMWWYPFTHENILRKCGDVQCFFTNNRKYFYHKSMKVFLMYGTSFDYMDLPFPRLPHHEWALLHEESPKNVYLFSHPEIMELFNHTATFKRESDFPIPTLWLNSLEELESTKYLVPVEEKTKYLSELALVNYVHSDCGCPSDRDHFVDMMQKYIKVDSYGSCKHNKDLPENLRDALRGMDNPEFFKIVAKYKFTLAVENAVCDDYMTEKLWRTFHVGSIPIIIGSPKIREFLPDNHSAILVQDFTSMKDLVDLINHLNNNDVEYNKYLQFKRPGGVTNKYLRKLMTERQWAHRDPLKANWVTKTECFLCERLHQNKEKERHGFPGYKYQATVEHYGCPKPKVFKGVPPNDLERIDNDWFAQEWISTRYEAKALKQLLSNGNFNFSSQQLRNTAVNIRSNEERGLQDGQI